MDGETCMELLKKKCPEKDDEFLQRLAQLCDNIPLAMCIAGSLVDNFEDSIKILEHHESDQYVNKAINMCYEKCSGEERETLVRLSIFEGSFGEDAAKVVTEKDKLDTSRILKKLVSRSLIKQPTKHRYSIHLLIKYFFKDKQEGGDEKSRTSTRKSDACRIFDGKILPEVGASTDYQKLFQR